MTDFSAEAIKTLLAHGAQSGPVKDLANGDQAILVPDGYEVQTVPRDKHALLPYVQASVNFSTDASFIRYVDEYKAAGTKLFGTNDSVIAYIDYHGVGKPERLGHIASLGLEYSREWRAWQDITRQPLDQKTFAEFLEENAFNVIDPDGATLLEIVTNLESKKNVEFSSTVRNSDGSTSLNYTENGETVGKTSKGRIPLPQKLKLGLPVYQDGPPYTMEVWLRININDAKAKFAIKLDNPEKVRRAAFKDICDGITSALGLEILKGSVVGSSRSR